MESLEVRGSKMTLSYDDILLVPKYSEINSRKSIDISSKLDFDMDLRVPIISSPMDTVTESNMAIAMSDFGGLGVIHRYNSIDKQVSFLKKCLDNDRNGLYACAIGVSGEYLERADALRRAGCKIICLDVAHGHHKLVKRAIHNLKIEMPHIHVMAGNVATGDAYLDLADWGADSIRVGIGGGSICSTRIQTGHGVPTLHSIQEIHKAKDKLRKHGYKVVPVIADGGIKNSGDIVKALAVGADFVMLGSLLAGTNETPAYGFETKSGEKRVIYRGMASKEAQNDWKGSYSSEEGVEAWVPHKGPVVNVLKSLEQGIRSGFSYSGARSLHEFQENADWIVQTSLGANESSTHILSSK